VGGHSKDTENIWKQEQVYFVRSVDERRAKIIAQAKAAREAQAQPQ
jgi:hypothetical protein